MQWLNEPAQWSNSNDRIIVNTSPQTDFWRVTHYGFIRDNGHFYFDRINTDFVVEVEIRGGYQDLYDQAGIMIRADEQDSPTRIRSGSHLEVARILAPAGEEGLAGFDLSAKLSVTANCPEVIATGAAGTVYLCHPFLAHASQINRGSQPRFMAQPPLYPVSDKSFECAGKETSSYPPIEQAIRKALGK